MRCGRLATYVLCAAAAAQAVVVPAGTALEVRLKTRVASNASKAQDPVEAVLIRPVWADGAIALPNGTVIKGIVKEAMPVKNATDRALVALEFTSAALPSGQNVAIAARVKQVDNARESVDQTGRIVGILSSETLASRINTGVKSVSERHTGLGDFLGTVTSSVLKEPQPEIDYEPGVEMTIETTKPVEVAAEPAAGPALGPVMPEQTIYDLVNSQPFQTTTEGQQSIPSDLTNLMFLGSRDQLDAAFTAAGWASAAKLSTASGLEVFRAVAEGRGYKEAPMSILLLDGEKPDVVFQKQNTTFAMRHHLRIWKRPGEFEGHTVWVCAATHDIGIEFSPDKRNFIHKIDSEIDRERAKVVSDLLFTGRVKALSLVERPQTPKQSQNATGDKLETDGRMAVLLLE
ncbi:MAG: LssY C-terminal domain-containing protein [Acidobacteriota bacterium]